MPITIPIVAAGGARSTVTLPDPTVQAPGGITPLPPYPAPGEFDAAPLATTVIFDDFDGAAGAKPNPALWLLDTINQGGTQTYRTGNVFLDGASNLVFEARRTGTNTYTSGRVTSRQKFNMGFGLMEARIKLPAVQGLLPAFWMLGINWPRCCELDPIELPGYTPSQPHFGVVEHEIAWGGYGYSREFGKPLSDDFHVYWCDRTPGRVRMGIDATTYADWTKDFLYTQGLPAGKWDLFEQPLYMIANLAVNVGWGPNATAETPFPQRMLIDWFRFTPS